MKETGNEKREFEERKKGVLEKKRRRDSVSQML